MPVVDGLTEPISDSFELPTRKPIAITAAITQPHDRSLSGTNLSGQPHSEHGALELAAKGAPQSVHALKTS